MLLPCYFGAGDQIGYADNFQDAMGILEEKISDLGGTTVGYWSRRSYNESKLIELYSYATLTAAHCPIIRAFVNSLAVWRQERIDGDCRTRTKS